MLGDDTFLGAHPSDASVQRKVQVLNARPLLLSLAQVCAYLDLSPATFRKVCPVPAVALGVAVARWYRNQIDEWVNTLAPEKQAARRGEAVPARPYDVATEAAEARRTAAVQKIRDRQNARHER